MNYKCTLSSAYEFAAVGRLEDWMHIFLLSDGRNKDFSDGLKKCERFYIGPMVMPLSLFTRCTGPEEGKKYFTPAAPFEKHVTILQKALEKDNDMPPLIANYANGSFELNDGNHRFEALTRMGAKEYPFIIWITDKHDYDEYNRIYHSGG